MPQLVRLNIAWFG